MQTLSGVPGVKAMNVGSGQSKPAIRGLGFNRMVVALDGIKHEGQQWGDEHGLEIDQFSIDRIDIVKGPAALLYGSDAIGGVINLYNNYIPTKPYQGSVSIFSRSNNESIGASARLEGKAEISSGAPTSRLSITLISRFQQIVFSTIHTIST